MTGRFTQKQLQAALIPKGSKLRIVPGQVEPLKDFLRGEEGFEVHNDQQPIIFATRVLSSRNIGFPSAVVLFSLDMVAANIEALAVIRLISSSAKCFESFHGLFTGTKNYEYLQRLTTFDEHADHRPTRIHGGGIRGVVTTYDQLTLSLAQHPVIYDILPKIAYTRLVHTGVQTPVDLENGVPILCTSQKAIMDWVKSMLSAAKFLAWFTAKEFTAENSSDSRLGLIADRTIA